MPLKMISLAKSTGTASLGMPSSWTRPPIRTAANAWCRADGTPDISHTTSAPSPPVAWRTVRTTSSSAALMVRCAPIRAASSSRRAFTSDAMTFAAPAARAMPTAKHPIGQDRVERVPDGVHDRPHGGGDAVQGQHVGDGHRDVLGERPVPVHADDAGVAADVPVAGAALEAVAAHDVSLGGDELSDLQVRDLLDPVTHGGDLARELVPHDHGRPDQ